MTYLLTHLQACDPEALDDDAAEWPQITVRREFEQDSMGFARVSVEGPTREAVLAYVREHWGDEDPEWWATWVAARVEAVA